MPKLHKANARDRQTADAKTYHPKHRGMSRAALVASRNRKRAMLARYT